VKFWRIVPFLEKVGWATNEGLWPIRGLRPDLA